MKKILLTILLSIFTTISYAEHGSDKHYKFFWNQVPAVCGEYEEVERFAKDKGFSKFSVSFGKEGGREDGDVVYAVTYWIGNDKYESMATINIPSSNETCILFRTCDLQLNKNLYEKGS